MDHSITVLIELQTAFFSIPVLRISNVTKITSKFCFNPVSEEFVTDIVNDLSWNTYWWKTPTENLERM